MAMSPKNSQSARWKDRFCPVRLFVTRVPRWMTNEQLYSIFSCYGTIVKLNILTSARGSKGCAFVMFSTVNEANTAISMMHNVKSLDEQNGLGKLQVRYAYGEIERLGLPVDELPGGENIKLFVGFLPKSTREDDLVNLFSRFGRVDEVHILQDITNNYDCNSAFVVFPKMKMAEAAIRCLDSQHVMANGRRSIKVRLAETNKLRLRVQHLMASSLRPLREPVSFNDLAPTVCPPPGITGVGQRIPGITGVGQRFGAVPYMAYPSSPVNFRNIVVPPAGKRKIVSYSRAAMPSTVRGNKSWREYVFADGCPYYYNSIINVPQCKTPPEFNNKLNVAFGKTGRGLYNNHNGTYPTAVPFVNNRIEYGVDECWPR